MYTYRCVYVYRETETERQREVLRERWSQTALQGLGEAAARKAARRMRVPACRHLASLLDISPRTLEPEPAHRKRESRNPLHLLLARPAEDRWLGSLPRRSPLASQTRGSIAAPSRWNPTCPCCCCWSCRFCCIFISQTVLIELFQKVNSPTKS